MRTESDSTSHSWTDFLVELPEFGIHQWSEVSGSWCEPKKRPTRMIASQSATWTFPTTIALAERQNRRVARVKARPILFSFKSEAPEQLNFDELRNCVAHRDFLFEGEFVRGRL